MVDRWKQIPRGVVKTVRTQTYNPLNSLVNYCKLRFRRWTIKKREGGRKGEERRRLEKRERRRKGEEEDGREGRGKRGNIEGDGIEREGGRKGGRKERKSMIKGF